MAYEYPIRDQSPYASKHFDPLCVSFLGEAMNNNSGAVEHLDLVDNNDNVLGRLTKQEIYLNGMNNFRVINCFLYKVTENRKDFLIWVPRRHPQKKLFPLHLDASVGGHVQSGETYIEAFRRECLEEINIDIENYEYEPLFKLHPINHGVSAFMTVYGLRWDSDLLQDPNFNREDIIESFWMKPQDLYDVLRQGKEKSKSDLIILLSHFIRHLESKKIFALA